MSKSLILSTISNATINNLSNFSYYTRLISHVKKEFQIESYWIQEGKAGVLEYRETLLKNGVTYDEAIEKTTTSNFDQELKELLDRKKNIMLEYNKVRKQLLKDFSLPSQELYAAYCLAVENTDITATGAITLYKGTKKEKRVNVKKALCSIIGGWLYNQNIKNADNKTAYINYCKKFIFLLGAKHIEKDNSFKAWNIQKFENILLSALIQSFIKAGLLKMTEEGRLIRKKELKAA